MFRRGMDLSWPLIIILAALFILSLQLPRQWQQTARTSRLELVSAKAPWGDDFPNATGSPSEQLPSGVFRSMRPADRIANNAGPLESSVAKASSETPVATLTAGTSAVTATATNLSGSPHQIILENGVPASAPVEDPATSSGLVIGSNAPSNKTGSLATSDEVPQAESPTLPVKSNDFTPADPVMTDEVRVLRDVRPTDAGPGIAEGRDREDLPLKSASRTESGIRRLPPTDSRVTEAQTLDASHADSDAGQQPAQPGAIPEPASSIAVETTNSARAAVPEPELPAARTTTAMPSSAQPVLPQSDPAVTANTASSANRSRPAEKAPADKPEAAVLPVSESPIGEPPMQALGRAWEEPSLLLHQLNELTKHDATQAWAREASDAVGKLGPEISAGAPETAEILQHLDLLTRKAPSLMLKIQDESLAHKLLRTSYVLGRHLAVWNQIGKMGGMAAANAPAPAVDPRRFNKCLSEIDQLTGNSSEGHAWRKYLMLESLHDWAARRRSGDERLPREMSLQVLQRLNPMSVSPHQRQFLTSGPLADLRQEMLRHAAEPVESNRLLQHIENYETSALGSDARLLARDCQFLSVSSGAAQRELGERIEMHYRNANLRIAVTADLLNRVMPKREPEYAPVTDVIQGAQVRGQSLTASEVAVRLIPDPHRVRLALEVSGQVSSLTRSMAGPATFYSDNQATYLARKPLEFTLRGIRPAGETQVAVGNNSKLRGISTNLDGLLLLSRFARNVAESQHDQKMPAADAEIREKIATRARDRIDRETSQQIAAAAKRLNGEVIGPMDSLMLDPTMIAAETTDKRFSMRIRLAGPDQLGAHTPRPQAPADSLASVQIHESMLNNVLDRLELDGQTFDLAGLGRRLAERLHRFQPKTVDPDQEDVKLTFAAKDALHVRCTDGRIEITLSIARLSKGRDKWKDFQVRAFYKPVVQGCSVDLARDGIVQLIAPRIRFTSQIALRGVFSKIFSQKEPIHATPEAFVKNPKLEGIVVTQLVIEDGWIGAAIGPQRTVTTQRVMTRR